jgi:hypothetical protein
VNALEEAKREAESLAMSLWKKFYQEDSPNFELCDSVAGVISQIDNMTCGLIRKYDDDEFNLMVERGTKAWADAPDATKWVDELRGNAPLAGMYALCEDENYHRVKVGKYTICRQDDKSVWIAKENCESGQFWDDKFEQCIETFFEDNF